MDASTALIFVSVIASGVFAGISGAMLWFRWQRITLAKENKELKDAVIREQGQLRDQCSGRFEKIWTELRLMQAERTVQLADVRVLEEKVANNIDRIDGIRDATNDFSKKMDLMNESFTKLLIEIRSHR